MRSSRVSAAGLTVLIVLASHRVGYAESSGAAPSEARQRFDRGLALYEALDYLGALAEFERAYELTQHPTVLYNVALVHAKLGNAVEVLEAVETLRARGLSELGQERRARLERTYAEQAARVGTIAFTANIPDLVVQLDHVDVPAGKLEHLRLTAGRHVVSAFAPGYAPKSLAINVMGGTHRVIPLELVPLAVSPGRVALSSDVPDVEVRRGAELVAKLPMTGELVLGAGRHELEFSRPGYTTARRWVDLAPGTRAALHVPMTPTRAGLDAGGRLVLAISEPSAIVEVDGAPQPNPAAGIALPRGRHSVQVRRTGFFDVARSVEISGGTTQLQVRLLPTPDYWADYVASARKTRTLAIVSASVGLVAGAAGAGFLWWNQGQKNQAERAFDAYADEVEMERGTCADDACDKTLEILLEDLEDRRARDVFGWVSVGFGAAAFGTGVLLYAFGDDPSRYDPSPESDLLGRVSLQLSKSGLVLFGKF